MLTNVSISATQAEFNPALQPTSHSYGSWFKAGAVFTLGVLGFAGLKLSGTLEMLSSWFGDSKSRSNAKLMAGASPILVSNFLDIGKGGTKILTSNELSATDPDDIAGMLIFHASNVQHGQFEYVAAPGVSISQFTQQDITNAHVLFKHDDSFITPFYLISVSDRTTVTNPKQSVVQFGGYLAYRSEFQIETYVNNSQSYPSVAGLIDGKFVVVWQNFNQSSAQYNTQGQIYNPNGTRCGSEFQVNTYSDQNSLSIAVLTSGKFVVTWCASSVYGKVYDLNGNVIGGQFQINTYASGSGSQGYPSVAALLNGRFAVVWQSHQDQSGSTSFGIYGQLYNSDRTPCHDEFRVNTYIDYHQRRPKLIGLLDVNDRFVVTWQSDWQDGKNDGIYGQIFDLDGIKDGSEFRANTYNLDQQDLPCIARLTNGGFVIIWESIQDDGSYYDINGQMYNSDGTRRGYEFRINAHTTDNQMFPSIASLANDKFIVTWTSYNQDGSGAGIYGQICGLDGEKHSSELRINTYTSSDQVLQSVTDLADGKFVVTWASYGQNNSDYSIYAQMYAYDVAPKIVRNSITVYEGSNTLLNTTILQAFDPDNNDTEILFVISGSQHCQFERLSQPNVKADNFTQQEINDGDIRFIHDNSKFPPVFNVSVSDGILTTMPTPAQITFNLKPKETSNAGLIGEIVGGITGAALLVGVGFFYCKGIRNRKKENKKSVLLEQVQNAVISVGSKSAMQVNPLESSIPKSNPDRVLVPSALSSSSSASSSSSSISSSTSNMVRRIPNANTARPSQRGEIKLQQEWLLESNPSHISVGSSSSSASCSSSSASSSSSLNLPLIPIVENKSDEILVSLVPH